MGGPIKTPEFYRGTSPGAMVLPAAPRPSIPEPQKPKIAQMKSVQSENITGLFSEFGAPLENTVFRASYLGQGEALSELSFPIPENELHSVSVGNQFYNAKFSPRHFNIEITLPFSETTSAIAFDGDQASLWQKWENAEAWLIADKQENKIELLGALFKEGPRSYECIYGKDTGFSGQIAWEERGSVSFSSLDKDSRSIQTVIEHGSLLGSCKYFEDGSAYGLRLKDKDSGISLGCAYESLDKLKSRLSLALLVPDYGFLRFDCSPEAFESQQSIKLVLGPLAGEKYSLRPELGFADGKASYGLDFRYKLKQGNIAVKIDHDTNNSISNATLGADLRF
jgi:hypothetical protein